MEISQILKLVDHTNLSPIAVKADIVRLCEDAAKYHTASVCVAQSYVSTAKTCLWGSGVAVCTVIGFPNGYDTTAAKIHQAKEAISRGADEIDMVINLGWVKDKKYDTVLEEIKAIKKACGDKILKVIIETCLLSDEEKIEMCRVVTESGADFIKTSTGFSEGGATFHDVELFSRHVGENVKIKAAGGISTIGDAQRFISLGASRLGTSRIVKIVKESE